MFSFIHWFITTTKKWTEGSVFFVHHHAIHQIFCFCYVLLLFLFSKHNPQSLDITTQAHFFFLRFCFQYNIKSQDYRIMVNFFVFVMKSCINHLEFIWYLNHNYILWPFFPSVWKLPATHVDVLTLENWNWTWFGDERSRLFWCGYEIFDLSVILELIKKAVIRIRTLA